MSLEDVALVTGVIEAKRAPQGPLQAVEVDRVLLARQLLADAGLISAKLLGDVTKQELMDIGLNLGQATTIKRAYPGGLKGGDQKPKFTTPADDIVYISDLTVKACKRAWDHVCAHTSAKVKFP